MIPVTHFVYLAVALFLIGLGGALFKRSVLATLACGQIMLAAAALVFVAYARWWGNHDGHVMAVIVALTGTAQLVVGLAIAHRMLGDVREKGGAEGEADGD